MSYLVLARKWRPKGFEDLIGQEPISRILSNAITQGRIAHAYLFSGPRGVGKTSTARILAKALNCEKGPTPSPCGTCASCSSIAEGSSVDVMEIDGASNNSVDDIRDLRERVKYAPAGGRYKVYIIDESHMLSGSAFNALLKTLEEPPSHVVFVLATTAPRKIPGTVLSRCQHLPFRRVPTQRIRERLRIISDSEGISISDEGIEVIARASEGSMRDSLTILDQVSAFSSNVEESEIRDLLGVADFRALSELSMAVINGDRSRILALVAELADRGTDLKSFTKDLMQFFRDLLVAKVVKKPEEMLDMSDSEIGVIKEMLRTASEDYLTVLLSEMIKAESDVRYAFSPRVALEMSLIRASFLSALTPVKEALENIESLMKERGERLLQKQKVTVTAPEAETKKAAQDAPAGQAESSNGFAEASSYEEPADNPAGIIPSEEPPPMTDNNAPVVIGRPPVISGDFWSALIKRIDEVNHPLASKLSVAEGRIEGDTLFITFNGGTAIHAEAVKRHFKTIEKAASEIADGKLLIRVDTIRKTVQKKKELKEKILSEPLIKEAIELFDGRIVDIKSVEKHGNGGEDVQENAR